MPITSGIDVVGKIVDPNGKPLSGAVVDGLIQYQGWSATKDDTFRVQGYYLDQPRKLFFHHAERNLAGYFKLEQSPPTDITIKLLPATAIRGRLVDQQGQPLSGIQISAAGVPYKDPQDLTASITTGADGHFGIGGLAAGHKYKMNARGRGIRFGDLVGSGELVVDAAAEPGQTNDLGDVPLQAPVLPGPLPKRDTASGATGSASVAEKLATKRIAGAVTAPDGKPAAGASAVLVGLHGRVNV